MRRFIMPKVMMLIIGGPNGAGKSSITNEVVEMFGSALKKLNADEETLALKEIYPDKPLPEINLMAAKRIDAEVDGCIEKGESFYVETVLSSPKYQDDVLKAKAKGYHFSLVYVSLFPPELSAQRVKIRAEKGGHGVPAEKVVVRYHRSHEQLEWFASKADILLIFDNSKSDQAPILLASKMAGQEITQHVKDINPTVDRVLTNMSQNKKAEPTP
jgi:predicted ABC-type ATPase